MFKFINNLKIYTRIALLSSAPILGLVLIGGVYLVGEYKIDAAIEKATAFDDINANFATIDHEVIHMRMVIRGIMLGSSAAQVVELNDAIMNSTQALSRTLKLNIDPAISKEVNKLKTLVPKYAAQVAKVEQASHNMGGYGVKGVRGILDKIQNNLMAFSDKLGADDVRLKIIEIITLANSYRYSDSAAADSTSIENSAGGIAKMFDGISKLRTDIDGLLAAKGVSPADKEKLGGLLDDFGKQVEVWTKINQNLESAMTGEEAIFGEIAPLFQPISDWSEQQLAATDAEVQAERNMTKQVAAGTAMSVVGLLLLIAFLVGRSIIGPVRAITGVFEKVAAGQQNISIPSQDQKDEIGQMARILASFHKDSAQATRTQSALDVASSPFMLADNDGSIIALNRSAQDMFDAAEADLQEVGPHFSAGAIAGGNLSMFGATLANH